MVMFPSIANVQTAYNNSDVRFIFIAEGSPMIFILTSDGNVSIEG